MLAIFDVEEKWLESKMVAEGELCAAKSAVSPFCACHSAAGIYPQHERVRDRSAKDN